MIEKELTWDDLEKECFTPEQIAASDLRAALIGAEAWEAQDVSPAREIGQAKRNLTDYTERSKSL